MQEDNIGTGQKSQPEHLGNGAPMVLELGDRGNLPTVGNNRPDKDGVGVGKQGAHDKVSRWVHKKYLKIRKYIDDIGSKFSQ